MTTRQTNHRADLARLAVEAMYSRGLEPEFSPQVQAQLASFTGPAREADGPLRDLTALPWCSIDNDDSRDLDQLSVSQPLSHGGVTVRVAIADVDALVERGTPVDAHAHANTTSVYTSARIFPMLPERLSTDLTSLNPHEERLALVVEMDFTADGELAASTLYRARVRNQAKLAYDAVAAWLDGTGELPPAAARVPGMDAQLRTQDALAQQLRARRREQGSLELETFQPQAVFDAHDRVVGIVQQVQNRARQLIEELMIATNGCTTRFLIAREQPSLRRVVRSPERWQRIVELAHGYGVRLPNQPDSQALQVFLARQHKRDPLRFPDLSLVVVKLMGSGEYVVERPHAEPIGHFGLAVRDYMHSTAPNRRFPDLITLRLIKAVLASRPPPYTPAELDDLAAHCTLQEDAAQKVERQLRKSEAALLLQSHIGQHFDAIVTGSSDKGTWVRIFAPHAEGKLVGGVPSLKVGQKLRVKLVSTHVERGFIDFVLAD